MPTVIVFGGSGLLGASLVPSLRTLGYDVFIQGRSEGSEICIDPYNQKLVIDVLLQYQPVSIINLIAATNVDQCEMNPHLAWKANASIVEILSNSIMAVNKKIVVRPHLVHISTDQVYDGLGPHSETDINLVNVYSLSKYIGELLAQRVGATVLRCNFYGRSRCKGKISFSDWLVHSLREQNSITVFDDVKFSAVHMDTLCSVIANCIKQRPVGTFNVGTRDSISKAGFAFALARALKLRSDQLTVGKSTELILRARRALDMTLEVSRLENVLNLQFPTILSEIAYTAKEYMNDRD